MVAELRAEVEGRPLQKVVQPDEHTLALRFMRRWVTLVAHPRLSRLHGLDAAPRAPRTPPAFCMLARKVLLNRPLDGLRQRPGDRVLHLEAPSGSLVAELVGRRSNLVLLDPDGVVLGSLKPSLLRAPVGQPYQPPDPGPVSPRSQICRFTSSAEAEGWFGQEEVRQLRQELTRRGGRLRRRARKTLARVEEDLKRCEDAHLHKKHADLLLAHQYQLPARGSSATVADLFEDGAELVIPLDPTLDVSQNAQRLYKKHGRLKRGRAHVTARLDRIRLRVDRLDRLMQELDGAKGEGLEDLADQLERLDPRPLHAQTGKGSEKRQKLPYRSFVSADGASIFVGRSAADNHKLTFHHARGRDTWLHLRDRPGSHGVIRAEGDVSHETLLDAATLVAHFSGIKAGEDTDVSHTLRKEVRPGGKPGQVYMSRSKTLHLQVQRGRLDRLLRKKGQL